MLVYYVLLIYIIAVSILYTQRKNKGRYRRIYFALIFLPVWLIMGLRYGVGKDFFSYQSIFNAVRFQRTALYSNIEEGYIFLNYIIGKLSSDSVYIFLVTSFIIVFFFLKGICEHSPNIMLSMVLFISLGYYFNAMNAVRQFMAIAITFYGIKYVNKGEWYKFLIIVLLASMFHKSAFVVVFTYIAFVFLKEKTFWIGTFAFFVIIHFWGDAILQVLRSNYWIAKFVKHNITTSRVSYYNIAIALVTFLAGYIVYLKQGKRQDMLLYLKYNWIALLSFLFLFNWGTACTRVAFYFTPVYLIIIPIVVKSLKGWKTRLAVQSALFLICAIYLMNMLNNSIITGNNFIPYNLSI